MSGVRVQHPIARSCRFTVVENDRPYPKPYTCTAPDLGGCGSVHLFKTHHLNLDDTGSAIVEKVLYQKIKHLLALNGFVETNEVKRPPTLGIGLDMSKPGAWGDIPIIHGKGT